MALKALILPRPVASSGEILELEEVLRRVDLSQAIRGSKRSGEGSGEGSKERRKRAKNMLNLE